MASIGRRGGAASKRVLTSETARNMVKLREARRAYRTFYPQCFWSYDPNLTINAADVPWVADQLMKHGNRKAWDIGNKLCR